VILVDAGPFVAAASPDDRHHEVCSRFLREPGDELGVSAIVVAEVSYLLKRAPNPPRPEIAFLRLIASERVQPVNPLPADYERMAELVGQYANLDLGAADASNIDIAERMGVSTIATVDRRDFSIVRPKHVAVFELVPDLSP
jgi:predicted nucleic acid-binding protein